MSESAPRVPASGARVGKHERMRAAVRAAPTPGAGPAARPANAGPRLGAGLWALFRFLPVLSWSASATAVGVAAAVGRTGWRPSFIVDGLLMLAGSALLQGFVAHGVNDTEDWRSGTDVLSPGLLSGGSRVIPRSLLGPGQLAGVVWAAGAAALLCAAILFLRHGPMVLPVAAVGLWAAVAYTKPPLRLAYRPFIGELLAGWPAVVAIIAGAAAVLSGPPRAGVWAAAAVQATVSVAWVMQHHLPDVGADLLATPPKRTTPAWFARKWGPAAARLAPAGYFLLGAAGSLALGLFLHPVFLGSSLLAALAARQALATDVTSVPDITVRQLRMIALTGANAALLILGFLCGGPA